MASLGGVRCLNSNSSRETPLFPTKIRGFPAENVKFLSKFDRQRGIRLRCPSALAVNSGVSDQAAVLGQPGYLTKLGESLSGFDMGVKKVEGDRKPTSQELDRLMKDSVSEIVKNIGHAPFLVHVYSEDEEGSASSTDLKLVIEKARPETWPMIKSRWSGDCSVPDGVILVEELNGQDDEMLSSEVEGLDSGSSHDSDNLAQPSSTKIWGLLIQGRGLNCPSCYILKTCRVQCCVGFSTHFCLAKADCLGKSLDFHMRKWWLQR